MEISQRQAEICAALADVHRLLLLYAMADGPLCVTDLVKRVGLSQPNVSRHLRIMRECGVVTVERRGKQAYYEPTDPRILQSMDLLRTMLADQLAQHGETARSALVRPPI